jgi:hypothetical protein
MKPQRQSNEAAARHMRCTYKVVRISAESDIAQHGGNVRFVPKADSCTAAISSLVNHLVGALLEL